jgi:hypothetical protein
MSPRAWVKPPPGPNDPQPCHCAGGWFNPRMYAECARCRVAYVQALKVVRLVFPGARIVGTPGIPETSAGEGPAGKEGTK